MSTAPELRMLLLLGWALSLCPPAPSWAFSKGASRSSCGDMRPGHIRALPQDPSRGHVTLHAGARSYFPGDTLAVAVRSTKDFMGFLLQARTVAGERPAGSFVLVPPGSRALTCVEDSDTVTHADKLLKRNLSFVWKAPDSPIGDIRFLITVVQSYFVYWAGIESSVVHDGTGMDVNAEGRSSDRGQEATSEPQKNVATTSPGGYNSVLPAVQAGREDVANHQDGTWQASSSPPPNVLAQSSTLTPRTLASGISQLGEGHASPTSMPEECHECEEDRQQSATTSNSALLQFGPVEGAVEPWQAEHSLLIGPSPEPIFTPSATSSQVGPAMYPELRASASLHQVHSGFMTLVTKSRVQKAIFTQNVSQAGNPVPPKEGKGKGETVPGRVPHMGGTELGVLLGMAAGLGMALALGLRCLHRQHCRKRSEVSLNERSGIIHVQECGDLVQVRKIRQDSFVLLQAEYSVLTPPGN